jgi:hypothetical protein
MLPILDAANGTKAADICVPKPDNKGEEDYVADENIKATFGNILAFLSKQGSVSLSTESVDGMLRSIYEWIMLNPNKQITLPTPPGSRSPLFFVWYPSERVSTLEVRSARDKRSQLSITALLLIPKSLKVSMTTHQARFNLITSDWNCSADMNAGRLLERSTMKLGILYLQGPPY